MAAGTTTTKPRVKKAPPVVPGSTAPSKKRTGAPPEIVPYQWKPGQSGNPAGRAKSVEAINRDIRVRYGGRVTEVMNALIAKALSGDVPAIKEFMDRMVGKARQPVDVSVDQRVSMFHALLALPAEKLREYAVTGQLPPGVIDVEEEDGDGEDGGDTGAAAAAEGDAT